MIKRRNTRKTRVKMIKETPKLKPLIPDEIFESVITLLPIFCHFKPLKKPSPYKVILHHLKTVYGNLKVDHFEG